MSNISYQLKVLNNKICSLKNKLGNISYIKEINNLELIDNNLVLSFTDENENLTSLSVSLSSLIPEDNVFRPTIVVNDYNELLTVTEQSLFEFAYVETSQGTKWLPGSLGGTYFSKGLYYWNGIDWINDKDEIFEGLNNIITVNTTQQSDIDLLKLESQNKNNLGWVLISDTQYTDLNRFTILNGIRTKVTNNAGSVIDLVGLLNGSTLWNPITNKLEPDNIGDSYDVRIQFTADPTLNNRNLEIQLDIGGTQGVIWDKTVRLARGAGVDTRVTEQLDLFTLNTFVSNGGEFFIICDSDLEIYNISFKIERKYRA